MRSFLPLPHPPKAPSIGLIAFQGRKGKPNAGLFFAEWVKQPDMTWSRSQIRIVQDPRGLERLAWEEVTGENRHGFRED